MLSQIDAYGLTLGVEAVTAALLAPWFGSRRWRCALSAVLGSLVTHPIVWRGAFVLYGMVGLAAVPLLEAFAIALETLVYRALAVPTWRRALLLSAIVNGTSWGLGVLIQARL